jgi:hypothetical protein
MMKMMILAARRAGMTHPEFRRYVTEVHGPLVKSVPEVADAIRHYHYNFPLIGASDTAFGHPLADHLDIVTEGWFDSRAAQLANMAEPRYLELVRPDEHRFANGATAVMHYTTDVDVLAGFSGTTKVFYFRRRHPNLTREQFQSAWRSRYSAALVGNSQFKRLVSRYVQNQTYPESDHPDGLSTKFFDVIDELSIRDFASLATLREDLESIARVRQVEDELLETSRTRALVTETVVNVP